MLMSWGLLIPVPLLVLYIIYSIGLTYEMSYKYKFSDTIPIITVCVIFICYCIYRSISNAWEVAISEEGIRLRNLIMRKIRVIKYDEVKKSKDNAMVPTQEEHREELPIRPVVHDDASRAKHQ